MAPSLPDAKGLEGRKEQPDPAPQSRDFFWDSIILYVVAVILGLAAIDVVFEFVRGSGVQCYLPNVTSQAMLADVKDYVIEFCSGRLPFLQFLPTFIAVHATLILAPHYLFFNAYGADLDFFFRHVSKLERTREPTSGDYPKINYVISQQMVEAFRKSTRGNGMFWLYIFKVLMQFVVCAAGAALVPTVLFTEKQETISFECPSNEDDTRGDKWPLPPLETVTCVFSPLRLLHNIWGIYLFLLALVVVITLINFFQLVKWHTRELGFDECTEFSFVTGMPYDCYCPDIMDMFSKILLDDIASILGCTGTLPPRPRQGIFGRIFKALYPILRPFTPYVIRSDYDFLMIRLFRTDGGLAYIMKELHVLRQLRGKNRDDLAKAYLYRVQGAGSDDESKGKLTDREVCNKSVYIQHTCEGPSGNAFIIQYKR